MKPPPPRPLWYIPLHFLSSCKYWDFSDVPITPTQNTVPTKASAALPPALIKSTPIRLHTELSEATAPNLSFSSYCAVILMPRFAEESGTVKPETDWLTIANVNAMHMLDWKNMMILNMAAAADKKLIQSHTKRRLCFWWGNAGGGPRLSIDFALGFRTRKVVRRP